MKGQVEHRQPSNLHELKPVFHFSRIVAKRSVFHYFVSTQAELMIWTQQNTLRFATIRLKWKTALKDVVATEWENIQPIS